MIKALQITPQAPGEKSGGELGVLQSSYSLSKCVDLLDYIGPEIQDQKILSHFHKCIFLDRSSSITDYIKMIINLEYNKRYCAWKRLHINFNDYDFIFLDFSKQAYVIKDIKKYSPHIPIITRIHNIEALYSKSDYLSKRSIKKYFIYRLTSKNEKYILQHSSKLYVLSENDKNVILHKYAIDSSKIQIVPVCFKNNKSSICNLKQTSCDQECISLLITGSLWFGPNAAGAKWFIENVYTRLKDVHLVLAGAHPNNELISICKKYHVDLVDTPSEMDIYFANCDLFVAPIFDGAGMKVKIAEAMSYGKPVLTTKFGAIGYKLVDKKNSLIANTAEEFIEHIQYYISLSSRQKEILVKESQKLFHDSYSYEASEILFKNGINQLIGE